MKTSTGNAFYISKSRSLLKQMDKFLSLVEQKLVEQYGKVKAASIHQEALDEYARIIPELPDIGGKANPLIQNLIQSASALALYRAIQKQGGMVEEAGELIHAGIETMLAGIPAFLRQLSGRLQSTNFVIQKMQAAALRSQERAYPGDWVWKIIPGDGKSLAYGIDYTECAILKFMQAQGASELMPHICDIDFVASEAMGTGLRRTMTLAEGCEKCNFRYANPASRLQSPSSPRRSPG